MSSRPNGELTPPRTRRRKHEVAIGVWRPQRGPERITGGGGGIAYQEFVHQQGFPKGPYSVEGLADYPVTFLKRLCAGSEFSTVATNMQAWCLMSVVRHGVISHSECSGRLSHEVALWMLQCSLNDLGGGSLRKDWLGIFRGCDIIEGSQRIMLNSGELSLVHVNAN